METSHSELAELYSLVDMIDEPNRSACRRLMADHGERFLQAPGSSFNHQAWKGGYNDHITDAMSRGVRLYKAEASIIEQLEPHEQFSLSDALLVLFWHDIEKLWCFVLVNGEPVADSKGRLRRYPELNDKAARKRFAAEKIAEYGVELTPNLRNGLEYVEGIPDYAYTPFGRVMGPLAALCHSCDTMSARISYNLRPQKRTRGNTQ